MRPRLLLVALAALAAGCTADDLALPEPEPGLDGPMTVYDETLDLGADPSGARREATLTFPAEARAFYFMAEWSPKDGAPTATRDILIELRDARGNVVSECALPATVTVPGSCGPKMNNVREGAYTLSWSGFGHVLVDVRVDAE